MQRSEISPCLNLTTLILTHYNISVIKSVFYQQEVPFDAIVRVLLLRLPSKI